MLALDLDLLAFRLGLAAEKEAGDQVREDAVGSVDPIRAMAKRMGLV